MLSKNLFYTRNQKVTVKSPGYVNYLVATPKSLDREVVRSADERQRTSAIHPNRSFQPRQSGIDVGEDCKLQNSPASTRIRAVNYSHNLFAMEAR